MSTEAELVSEINDAIDKLQDKATELQDAVNAGLDAVPFYLDWIFDRVREGWDAFVAKMQEFWDWLGDVVAQLGSPTALTGTADRWSDSVGGPVSAEVQNAEAGSLLVDDTWEGSAAEQYRQMLPMQKAALEKIKFTLTDGIGNALREVSTAIFVFWGALVAALAALVAGLIGAITSAATVFGLPAAPFIAAGAVAVALAACWGGTTNLRSAAAGANTTLRQKLNDNAAYRDGHWPPATA